VCDLYHFIHETGLADSYRDLGAPVHRVIARQLCNAVRYLHTLGRIVLVHNDVRSKSVAVFSDQLVKLSSFTKCEVFMSENFDRGNLSGDVRDLVLLLGEVLCGQSLSGIEAVSEQVEVSNGFNSAIHHALETYELEELSAALADPADQPGHMTHSAEAANSFRDSFSTLDSTLSESYD